METVAGMDFSAKMADMENEKHEDIHSIKCMQSSLNKQKCLANPVFMRVCGLLKGLLITN